MPTRTRLQFLSVKLALAISMAVSSCGERATPGPLSRQQSPSGAQPQELMQPPHPSPAGPPAQGPTPQPPTPSAVTGDLAVHFIDVSQGDSVLIQLPGGKTMLIDTGDLSEGSTVVSYRKAQGMKSVDYLVATHPHADHIGGMVDVLDAFPVKDVFMPRTGHTMTTYENLLLKLKGLKVTEAKARVPVFEASNLSAAFIAPHGSKYDDLNDWSAVLRLRYGDIIFLFTENAGESSEAEMLLSSVVSPKADVLRVGHHGSNSSTSDQFLKIVRPRYAVISCGGANSGSTGSGPATSPI